MTHQPTLRRSVSSRRSRTLWAVQLGTLAVAGALCAGPLTASSPEAHAAPSAGTGSPSTQGWISQTIGRMTLEEKVGQLFMTYAYGPTAETNDPRNLTDPRVGAANARELIDRYKLGGIIYFAWADNVQNPEQIAGLSNGIQEAMTSQRMQVPGLVATDQEGGLVVRVGPPATQFPGNMALGAGRSTDDARRAAAISGTELAALGINQNFGPVADVNVNPLNPVIGVRSFSEDPSLAADLTAAQVGGYHEGHIASTAKHFPGHGDTDTDSHTGIPMIDHTRAEVESIDLPPFEAAIDHDIDAIMTAHIIVPSIDPSGDPATLSRPILTGVLRKQLGFDGVVITDSLGMAGVRAKYGDDRVPVLALKAGVDMLLMPPDLDLAYNAVLDAVRSGEISMPRLHTSLERILRLKAELGLVEDPHVDAGRVDEVVGTPEHYAQAQRIADRTTTLVKNDDGVLPLAAGSGQDVLVTGWGDAPTQTVADKMAERGVHTDVLTTGANPPSAQIDAAVAAASAHDLTVVTSYRAWENANRRQQTLVQRLLTTGKPVVVVSVRDAYDIAYYPQAPTYAVTYGYNDVALESLVRVLFGEVNPSGRLPVTIPTADDPDTALFPFGHGLGY